MKKIILGTVFVVMLAAVPVSAFAAIDVHIGINLPPMISFSAPPSVIVLPDAPDVYVVPDIDDDLFFWNGWWWRFWDGRWFRSRYYDRAWSYFDGIPGFFVRVHPDWRRFYYDHAWSGFWWDYEVIPYQHVKKNWRNWKTNKYWERQKAWGVHRDRPYVPPHRRDARDHRPPQIDHRLQIEHRPPQPQVARPVVPPAKPPVIEHRLPAVHAPQQSVHEAGKSRDGRHVQIDRKPVVKPMTPLKAPVIEHKPPQMQHNKPQIAAPAAPPKPAEFKKREAPQQRGQKEERSHGKENEKGDQQRGRIQIERR